jgi:hypothetical protein
MSCQHRATDSHRDREPRLADALRRLATYGRLAPGRPNIISWRACKAGGHRATCMGRSWTPAGVSASATRLSSSIRMARRSRSMSSSQPTCPRTGLASTGLKDPATDASRRPSTRAWTTSMRTSMSRQQRIGAERSERPGLQRTTSSSHEPPPAWPRGSRLGRGMGRWHVRRGRQPRLRRLQALVEPACRGRPRGAVTSWLISQGPALRWWAPAALYRVASGQASGQSTDDVLAPLSAARSPPTTTTAGARVVSQADSQR